MRATGDQPGNNLDVVRDALKKAARAGGDQSVVFHLSKAGGAKPPAPEETKQIAENLISRACNITGHEPRQKTILQNLGSVRVQAHPELLLKMLDQPEVADASLNPDPENPVELIRPVRKSPAKSSGWA